MRKVYVVRLNQEERSELSSMVRKGKAAAYKLTHARILLQCDQGEEGPAFKDADIAASLNVADRTVARVRQRFVEGGFDAALHRKKQVSPSRRPRLDGEGEARLIALSCSQAPEGRCDWTLRLLADKMVELEFVEAISHETVRQTLKKTS